MNGRLVGDMVDTVSDASCTPTARDECQSHQQRAETGRVEVPATAAVEVQGAIGENAQPGRAAASPSSHASPGNDVHKAHVESEVARSQDGELEGSGSDAAGFC